jgi:micrococcal nuclease
MLKVVLFTIDRAQPPQPSPHPSPQPDCLICPGSPLESQSSAAPSGSSRAKGRTAIGLAALLSLVLPLSSCVKAQGPVVQQGAPETQTSQGRGPAQQGAEVGTSQGRPQIGGVGTSPGDNRGVTATPGSVVVEAIRKGPLQANGAVTHLVDGDTVDVSLLTQGATLDAEGKPSGKLITERIRLIGIDTPETKRPNTPVECFGREASSALAALLPVGTPVLVERDVEERDRYGRLLGYVFRASDGLFVNHEMVRAGMAVPFTFPPNIAYVDVFAAAGDASRAAAVGLWSRCESGHTPVT